MKTQAEIAAARFATKSMELVFAGTALPTDWCQWIRENVSSPQGHWLPALSYGDRPPIIAVVEYDDGSHLDILPGSVVPW